MQIAVLFARADSIYKTLPECDVWDATRDARKWLVEIARRTKVHSINKKAGPFRITGPA